MSTNVPFKVDAGLLGLTEAGGLLVLEHDRLRWQFQVKDSVIGAIKSRVKAIDVSLSAVESVRFKRGWLGGGRLTIRLRDLRAGEHLPGHEAGVVTVRVERRDALSAQELATSRPPRPG